MRTLLVFAFAIPSIAALGQNWALLNPTYKYNYSDDGTDTISNQVFAMDVQTLGTDSFLFELNPIGSSCAPCNGAPAACASNAGLYSDRPQVFGLRAIAYGSQWTLIGEDSLLVEASASVGTNWVGLEGIQGTVTSVAEEVLFGQPDSVKQIDFSNGASMKISKAHGVAAFSANGGSYALIGVQGGLDAGEHFPRVIDLFDYHPGDTLQYHGTNDGTDGFCYYSTTYTKQYEVLSRADLPGHTDYTIRVVEGWDTWATPIVSGGCSGGGSGSNDNIVTLGIDHDSWTEDNFLGSCWLNQLWPQGFAEPPLLGGFAGEFGSTEVGSQWRAYLDVQGRYVLEPVAVQPDQPDVWSTLAPCFGDTSYWQANWDQIIGRYVEGIGFTYGRYLGFEHSSEEILEAYHIGGEEFGELTPDDVILGLHEEILANDLRITPNPADDRIVLGDLSPGGLLRIHDLDGRLLKSHRTISRNEVVDVHDLAPGVYMVIVEGLAPQRLVIAR